MDIPGTRNPAPGSLWEKYDYPSGLEPELFVTHLTAL